MANYTGEGDSIEGKKISTFTRRQALQAHLRINGKGYFKYSCKINAKSKIEEKLDEGKPILFLNSSLNVGDQVSGDAIELYSTDMLTFKKESNYSSKHGIQKCFTKKYGASQIKIPFRFAAEKPSVAENPSKPLLQ